MKNYEFSSKKIFTNLMSEINSKNEFVQIIVQHLQKKIILSLRFLSLSLLFSLSLTSVHSFNKLYNLFICSSSEGLRR